MSSTGNMPDSDRSEIETRARTFRLHHHPKVWYSVVLERPHGSGPEAWALTEVTMRADGRSVTQSDMPPVQRLLRAALYDEPPTSEPSMEELTRDLEWIPMQYRRALHKDGVNTFGQLQKLTREQLLNVPGVGPRGVAAIDAALAEHRTQHPIDLDAIDFGDPVSAE